MAEDKSENSLEEVNAAVDVISNNAQIGYDFYRNVLGSPKHVLAPMVDQSELAFRAMSRELGVDLCYTPMWHAGIFSKDEKYRKAAIEKCPNDRPLLFQVSFLLNDIYTAFRE